MPIWGAVAGDDGKHQVDFGKKMQFYASDAFPGVETVLANKDYKEIKALRLMMPNAEILLCQVHAHRDSRRSISASQCDVDDARDLFRNVMYATNARIYDQRVALMCKAHPHN